MPHDSIYWETVWRGDHLGQPAGYSAVPNETTRVARFEGGLLVLHESKSAGSALTYVNSAEAGEAPHQYRAFVGKLYGEIVWIPTQLPVTVISLPVPAVAWAVEGQKAPMVDGCEVTLTGLSTQAFFLLEPAEIVLRRFNGQKSDRTVRVLAGAVNQEKFDADMQRLGVVNWSLP